MRELVIEKIMESVEWVESGEGNIVDAMTDVICECYQEFGICDELDEIFKSIGWIDDEGDTVFENWMNYHQIIE